MLEEHPDRRLIHREAGRVGCSCFTVVLLACSGLGQAAPDVAKARVELNDLTLEELMDVEISSAARKTQRLSDAMNAVHVVTAEDIRRSGATTIPDVLRTVPGVHVARMTGSTYAISVRGFTDQFANKLLVMIDGRSVYTPLYSGVYWDAKDVLLEDVLRIEVVRGPGGALWGSNAVNGVINIITKKAEETQGSLLFAAAGNEERTLVGVRHGFRLDEGSYARVYAKYFDRDGQTDATGVDVDDDWRQKRTGFRVDHEFSNRSATTLQGDYYSGRSRTVNNLPSITPPYNDRRTLSADLEGGNVLSRWRYKLSDKEDVVLQAYVDFEGREELLANQHRRTADVEALYRVTATDDLEVMLGLGYRRTDYNVDSSQLVTLGNDHDTDDIVSGSLRAEHEILEDELSIAIGVKLEHNDYTGFETQPDIRFRYSPHDRHSFWGAYSRAVRVPSRAETELTTVLTSQAAPGLGGLALQTELTGNPNLSAEDVLSTEFGYRGQLADTFSLDVALFYNEYDGLIAARLSGPATFDPGGPRIVQPVVLGNSVDGEAYGGELAARWQPTDWYSMRGSYSLTRIDLHTRDAAALPGWNDGERTFPAHQAQIRMRFDASDSIQFDSSLAYTDHLGARGVGSYLRWDVRVGWIVNDDLEASLVLQNLLDDRHLEAGTVYYVEPTETERSIHFKLTTRF